MDIFHCRLTFIIDETIHLENNVQMNWTTYKYKL